MFKAAAFDSFTHEQVADWKAPLRYHADHPTPEADLSLPYTYQMEGGRSHTIEGMLEWQELWRAPLYESASRRAGTTVSKGDVC